MPNPPPDPLLGAVLSDHIRLDSRLGAGAMGAVYAAHDLTLERPVAIKVLLPEATPSREARARLLREARITAALRHDSIPVVFSAGIDPITHRFYIAHELLSGHTLAHELFTWRPPPRFAITRILAILDALGVAHERDVVHRDLKPANIFLAYVGPHERAYVLDFGLSKALQPVRVETKLTRGAMGTPQYTAPEAVHDASRADVRSDVWSAGIVLYEMLTRALPWRADNFVVLRDEIAAGKIPDVREFCPWPLPEALVRVLHRALQLDPDARYRDALEFADAIRELDLRSLMSLTTAHRRDGVRVEGKRYPAAPNHPRNDDERAITAARVEDILVAADLARIPPPAMNMLRWACELGLPVRRENNVARADVFATITLWSADQSPMLLPAAFLPALRRSGLTKLYDGTWAARRPPLPIDSLRLEV